MTRTSKGGYVAVLAGAVLVLSMGFYGCSQEKAPQEAPKQAAPVAEQRQPTGQRTVEDIAKAKEHFMKGVQLARSGKIDEAIKEYEASITINPNSPEALSNLGYALYDKGLIGPAIDAQVDAIKINPELANAYFGLGLAFEANKDKKNAIEAWKQYVARAEPHSKYWMVAQEHIAKLEGRKMKKTKLKAQPAPSNHARVEKAPEPAKDAK
ncbi:MAG: hypothetical protein A3J24_06200 [Deltaproteobacteria bacterium RIFCSPLOWO2_02_FULL_53_8]|nr:MAG: hypothetical protein A3J24_06200 [Deltaproteobacteria bacterium RIFCSPLOWO2_02_FULL_53_8]